MAAERFCRDCKHSRGEGLKMTCDSPKNYVDHVATEKYLVTGIVQPVVKAMLAPHCVTMRKHEKHPQLGVDMCGYFGEWFEPKESEHR